MSVCMMLAKDKMICFLVCHTNHKCHSKKLCKLFWFLMHFFPSCSKYISTFHVSLHFITYLDLAKVFNYFATSIQWFLEKSFYDTIICSRNEMYKKRVKKGLHIFLKLHWKLYCLHWKSYWKYICTGNHTEQYICTYPTEKYVCT